MKKLHKFIVACLITILGASTLTKTNVSALVPDIPKSSSKFQKSETEDKITYSVSADCYFDERLEFSNSQKSIVIEGNNKTITFDPSLYNGTMIVANMGTDVTIKNCTINYTCSHSSFFYYRK